MGKTTFAIRRCLGLELKSTIVGLNSRGMGTFNYQPETTSDFDNSTDHRPAPIRIEVDGALPGDQVEVVVRAARSDHAEAMIKSIKTHHQRIEPRCCLARHDRAQADRCGGCALQNINYDTQLKLKRDRVVRAMRNVGFDTEDGVKKTPYSKENPIMPTVRIAPTLPAPDPWYFRHKMELSFGPCHDELGLGLHPRGYKHEVVELEQCHLLDRGFAAFSRAVLHWCRQQGLPAFIFRRNSGWLRLLTVRRTRAKQRMVILTTSAFDEIKTKNGVQKSKDIIREFTQEILHIADKLNYPITSLYWSQIDARKGAKTRVIDHLLHGDAVITETLTIQCHENDNSAPKPLKQPPEQKSHQTLHFEILPHAFFQPNIVQAEKLYSIAISTVIRAITNDSLFQKNPKCTPRILDLYCGTGTIALAFASAGFEVVGIDIEKQAIANAKKNALQNNLSATFIANDTAKALSQNALNDIAVTVVDPPRRGLLPDALTQIIAINSPYILYISCQPDSLARDLSKLISYHYKIEDIQPVDMLPQSAHIECVALLKANMPTT